MKPSQTVVMFCCVVCATHIWNFIVHDSSPSFLSFMILFCALQFAIIAQQFSATTWHMVVAENDVVQYILLKNIYMKPSQTVVMFCCVVCAKHIWNFIAHASSPPFCLFMILFWTLPFEIIAQQFSATTRHMVVAEKWCCAVHFAKKYIYETLTNGCNVLLCCVC